MSSVIRSLYLLPQVFFRCDSMSLQLVPWVSEWGDNVRFAIYKQLLVSLVSPLSLVNPVCLVSLVALSALSAMWAQLAQLAQWTQLAQ